MTTATTRREKEIWEACDELWHELQQDDEPVSALTGDKLRDKLVQLGYKRGNQNQLYQFRNTWLTANDLDQVKDLREKNDFLSERVEQIVGFVMKEIQADADEKVEQIHQECDEKLNVILGEKNELAESLSSLEQSQQNLTEQFEQLKITYEKRQNDFVALEKKCDALQQSEVHLNNTINSLKNDYERQTAELRQSYETGKADLRKEYDAKIDLHKQSISDLKSQHEDYRHKTIVEIDGLKLKNQELDKALYTSQHKEQQSQNKLTDTQVEIKTLTQKHDDQLQKINALETTISTQKTDYQVQIHELEKTIAERKGEMTANQRQIKLLQQQLDAAQQHIQQLTRVNAQLQKASTKRKVKERVES